MGDAAFKMRLLRDLEEDVVPSRLRAAMHAAPEPRLEDKYAAFARRAPSAQRRWQAAIPLRKAKFRGFVDHRSPALDGKAETLPAPPLNGADRTNPQGPPVPSAATASCAAVLRLLHCWPLKRTAREQQHYHCAQPATELE
jgi:hypothetical protein